MESGGAVVPPKIHIRSPKQSVHRRTVVSDVDDNPNPKIY